MYRRLAIILMAATLVAADEQDLKKELDKLQGDWIVESTEMGGQKQSGEEVGGMSFTITDNKYAQKLPTRTVEEGTMKLDLTKKPATIDLIIMSGMDKGKTQLGVYELKDDKLTIALNIPGEEKRPTELKAGGGVLFVMKKVKK